MNGDSGFVLESENFFWSESNNVNNHVSILSDISSNVIDFNGQYFNGNINNIGIDNQNYQPMNALPILGSRELNFTEIDEIIGLDLDLSLSDSDSAQILNMTVSSNNNNDFNSSMWMDLPQMDGFNESLSSTYSNETDDSIYTNSDQQLNQSLNTQTNKIKRIKSENRDCKKPKKKPINMKECLHVWEFLKDMLKNQRPEVEWCDAVKGIFRIVDPKKVACEWGVTKTKSESKVMSYPNMARGIRYSREAGGYFDKVDSTYGFGIKLVYKFSRKARDNCKWLQTIME